MNISRDKTKIILFLVNELIPPILRDRKWFMTPLIYFAYGAKAGRIFRDFREHAYALTDEEFAEAYEITTAARYGKLLSLQAESDLNQKCEAAILDSVAGETILDVGCGRGYLADLLRSKGKVTGVDIMIGQDLIDKYPDVEFKEGSLKNLPFEDSSFDTVVCSHTLEHVRDIHTAVEELRRVTRKRLIIVVPLERAYRYQFNLHLHFFPYPHSFLTVVGARDGQVLQDLGGDLFYCEDVKEAGTRGAV
ncbi:MAG: class I SAM-dependent methyltransferase [Verrucomicrobia bacterium]|nr:class I SAM-dependent methyltransferase [Verrucomicrobiota bacterium]